MGGKDRHLRGQHADAEKRLAQIGDKITELAVAKAPGVSDQGLAYFMAERDSADIVAREALLVELRERMAKKPSFAIAEAWFQEKLDGVNTLNHQWDELGTPLRPLAAANQPEPREFYVSVGKVIKMQGEAMAASQSCR